MNEPRFTNLVQNLSRPSNFFEGISPRCPHLPENILLFSNIHVAAPHTYPVIHHRCVMILGLHGQGGVIVDGALHRVGPNRGVLIFPFQQHYYARADTHQVLRLFISFESNDLEAHASLRNRTLLLNAEHWQFIEKIAAAFQRSEKIPSAGHAVSLWLGLLLESLADSVRGVARRIHGPTSRLQHAVQRMVQFIIQNVHQMTTVFQIARATGVSESHLRRICHQNLGLSLGRFVRRVRISHACKLLTTTEGSVTEIAANSGFASLYSFSRTFKKETGLSPLKYRQRRRIPPARGSK